MRLFKLTSFILGLAVSTLANAVVIGFDDINGDVPDGYQGLQWDNMYVLAGNDNAGTGYQSGMVSSPNVAYNGSADPAAASDGQFSLCSAWFTAAWNTGLEVTVEGWLDGSQEYTRTVVVDNTGATQFFYDFIGIDELRFTSAGGVDAGDDGGSGEHFALDDMDIEIGMDCEGNALEPMTPVPTMSQWSLITLAMLLALGGILMVRRRA